MFSQRAGSYVYAARTYPRVMDYENFHIVQSLKLKECDRILHLTCAGVYIQPFFGVSCEYVRVEQNETLAQMEVIQYCPLDSIPFEDSSFDKIVIVASLHHYPEPERNPFMKRFVVFSNQMAPLYSAKFKKVPNKILY
jgi:hypothetical protein